MPLRFSPRDIFASFSAMLHAAACRRQYVITADARRARAQCAPCDARYYVLPARAARSSLQVRMLRALLLSALRACAYAADLLYAQHAPCRMLILCAWLPPCCHKEPHAMLHCAMLRDDASAARAPRRVYVMRSALQMCHNSCCALMSPAAITPVVARY